MRFIARTGAPGIPNVVSPYIMNESQGEVCTYSYDAYQGSNGRVARESRGASVAV